MAEFFHRNPTVELQALERESILFDPDTNRFFVLNSTSAFIWQQIEKPSSAEQIAHELCAKFSGVVPEQAVKDVEAALQEMRALNVVLSTASAA